MLACVILTASRTTPRRCLPNVTRVAGSQPTGSSWCLIGTMLAAHRVPAAATSWALMLSRRDPSDVVRAPAGGCGIQQPAGRTATSSLSEFPAAMAVDPRVAAAVSRDLASQPAGHGPLSWSVATSSRRATTSCSVRTSYIVTRRCSRTPRASAPSDGSRTSAAMRTHFLPFGAGPRACPGSQLAMTTVASTLLTAARWDIRMSRRRRTPGPANHPAAERPGTRGGGPPGVDTG